MGLGPVVCQHCQVLAALSDTPITIERTSSTTTYNTVTYWYCKYCGETDLKDHAGFGDWKKYLENERFLEFVHSKPVDQ